MPFLGVHLDWCPPGHPALAAVDLGHPHVTGLNQLGSEVVVAQAGVDWHQDGLEDRHRRLAAAFGLGVRQHTRRDRDPVGPLIVIAAVSGVTVARLPGTHGVSGYQPSPLSLPAFQLERVLLSSSQLGRVLAPVRRS